MSMVTMIMMMVMMVMMMDDDAGDHDGDHGDEADDKKYEMPLTSLLFNPLQSTLRVVLITTSLQRSMLTRTTESLSQR